MSTNPITVVAQAKAKPGLESQVQKELIALVSPSRDDEGCISYDLHQLLDSPASFMFHENWASKAIWDKHMQTPHVQGTIARITPMLAEAPLITIWNKIA